MHHYNSNSALLAVLVVSVMTVFVTLPSVRGSPIPTKDYIKARTGLIHEDSGMRLGGKLVLTQDEKIVSDIFVKEKTKLVNDSFVHGRVYMPSLSFYQNKPLIDNSTLFKLIQQMPKGAALHLHDSTVASLDWLIKNATYRDNVYMCVDNDSYIIFHVYKNPPSNPGCVWKLVKDERAKAKNITLFDLQLKRNVSFLTKDPFSYPDNTAAWVRFYKYFAQVTGLICYEPVFRDYYWQALKEFRADNVQYIELRFLSSGVYALDGTQYDTNYVVQLYQNLTAAFVKEFPDFSGAKVILSGSRNKPMSEIMGEVKTAVALNKKYPNFMMGYDLVGYEVAYHPLIDYIEALLYPARMDPPYHLPYFFHAGETVWQGTSTDDNIFDAILLNTTRIGHGYALTKHPKLLELVMTRKIAVEVNPISNQVLRLVRDLRNHPMTSLIADNFPIVISSDDPTAWEAAPLSHDFYMAFMDMTGEDDDLTFLKQLALNSIEYSVMSPSEKDAARKLWQAKWDKFIKDTILEYSSGKHFSP